MKRAEANALLEAFGNTVGHGKLLLDDSAHAGVEVELTPVYFAFFEQGDHDGVLECAAEIHSFDSEPKPEVLRAFAAEAAAGTGSGDASLLLLGRSLCLARRFPVSCSEHTFQSGVLELVAAAVEWMTNGVERVSARMHATSTMAEPLIALATRNDTPYLTPNPAPPPKWNATNPEEQVWWAFGQQDYPFCVERLSARLSEGAISHANLQLLIISLQRLGSGEQAAHLADYVIARAPSGTWPVETLRLTLGLASVQEVLASAETAEERWLTWFYAWSRALTTWRRQLAFRARAQCEAIDEAVDHRIGLPEKVLLHAEANQFNADTLHTSGLSSSGIVAIRPKRELRVFVSSTFNDLKAERAALAARVFPELRGLAEARHVRFSEVDLRWGITDAQAAAGEVLPLCLAAIDLCRPYFIGILGSRYGWQPERFSESLLHQHPWLSDYAGCSVTEIEFRYGALNSPTRASAAFYLRDGAEPGAPHDDANRRLDALKHALRSSTLPVAVYDSIDGLVETVSRDLRAWLDSVFPLEHTPSVLELELARHEVYALARSETYVGSWETLAAVDEWVLSGGATLLVSGRGHGVSAFLAEWGRRWRRAHPEDITLLHFVGAGDRASSWLAILARLAGELQARSGIAADAIDSPAAAPEALLRSVRRVAEQMRVVIVIDGLHELDPSDAGDLLGWLPLDWPANVKLVLSSADPSQSQRLTQRSIEVLELPALDQAQRVVVIEEYLQRWSKALDEAHVQRLSAIEAAGEPMFLGVLLDELRLSDSHESLPMHIERLAGVSDLPALLQHWLARLEDKHEVLRVRAVMQTLFASRHGRSETELLALFGATMPQRLWLPMWMDLLPLLRAAEGTLRLPASGFREAIRTRYLADPRAQCEAYRALERLLAQLPLSNASVRERPELLRKAGDWSGLAALLSDRVFFQNAWHADPSHVLLMWSAIEGTSELRRVEHYRAWWAGASPAPQALLHELMAFFSQSGLLDVAYEIQCASSTRPTNTALHARQIGEIARLAYLRGELAQALSLYREQEALYLAEGEVDSALMVRCNQALVLKDQGQLAEALTIQEQGERRWRELRDDRAVAMALGNQGVIHALAHDYQRALECHDEELRIYFVVDDASGRQRSQANRAVALHGLRRIDEAISVGEDALRVASQLGEAGEIASAHANLGTFLRSAERFSESSSAFRSAAACYEHIGNIGLQASLLAAAGESAQKANDAEAALSCYAASEQAYRVNDDLTGALAEVRNQALVLHLTARPEQAMERYGAAEVLARALNDREALLNVLTNQVILLAGPLRRYEVAAPLLEEASQLVTTADPESLQKVIEDLKVSFASPTREQH